MNCDLCHCLKRQKEREKRIFFFFFFFLNGCVCSSSVFRSGISVYLLDSLPPDSAPAPSQLASYWSPNCSSAFGFIVLYWCVLKVHILYTHTQHSEKSSRESDSVTYSVTPLISPLLGGITPPAVERKRKESRYLWRGAIINRLNGPSAELISVCMCVFVYACQILIPHVFFSLRLSEPILNAWVISCPDPSSHCVPDTIFYYDHLCELR